MRNLNKHALTNYKRLVRICDTLFFGGYALLCGVFIFYFETMKSSGIVFLFLTGEEKKAEKKELTFFVPLVCTVCWLNISCTNCYFFKNFWGRGTRKEEKEEKERNPKKRRILMNTQACLRCQNSPTADSCWVHFNFSLITHPFFKPEELITYLCEVPYAMRPFRISSFRHSPRNQQ